MTMPAEDLRAAVEAAYTAHQEKELEDDQHRDDGSEAGEPAYPDAERDGRPEADAPDNGAEGEVLEAETPEDRPETAGEAGVSEPGGIEGREAISEQVEEPGETGTDAPVREPARDRVERPPVGWKAEARVHWDKIPPTVQREVLRREQEVNDVLRQTAEARQFGEAFSRVMAPYQPLLQAAQTDPLVAVQSMMQTAATLRTGTAQQKAQAVAQVIRDYGIDIATLDETLAGAIEKGAPGALSPDVQQLLDQRLAPVNQFIQQHQQEKQNESAQQANAVSREIENFASDPKNIFFEDVRDNMAVLLQAAATQGKTMSLKQAYDLAVSQDPKLQKIVDREKIDVDQEQQTQARRRKAAASVKSSAAPPAPAQHQAGKNLRADIEAAFASVEGGSR